MKKMRRLIPAFAMLMVAAVMLSTASFAWFTIGTYATATGMSVTAEAASSLLIINGDKETGVEYTVNETDLRNAFNDADNTVKFDRAGENLQPATLTSEKKTVTIPGETGEEATTKEVTEYKIQTLKDATYVDHITGKLVNGYEFEDAAENTNYVEYVAYIASAGAQMGTANGDSTLNVTVTLPEEIEYLNKAVTITFWVADSETEEAEYRASTTLLAVETAKAEGKSVTLDLGTKVIPEAVTEEGTDATGSPAYKTHYVKVYMRVYYDGALVDDAFKGTDSEGTTYVRNEHVGASGAAFEVRFDFN